MNISLEDQDMCKKASQKRNSPAWIDTFVNILRCAIIIKYFLDFRSKKCMFHKRLLNNKINLTYPDKSSNLKILLEKRQLNFYAAWKLAGIGNILAGISNETFGWKASPYNLLIDDTFTIGKWILCVHGTIIRTGITCKKILL